MEGKIDISRTSRQALTYGLDAMKKMNKCSVLISGMKGLGIEIAKCVILGGAKKVVLDFGPVITYKDLSSAYYVNESDVGTNGSDKIYNNLKSLNPHVEVKKTVKFGKFDEETIKQFSVIVFCDQNMYDLVKYNEIARRNNVKFIMVNSHGLYGYIFNDFGKDFEVSDSNGVDPRKGVLLGSTTKKFFKKEYDNVVVSFDKHGLETGDEIKVSVKNQEKGTFVVDKVIDTHHFLLKDDPLIGDNFVETEFVQIKKKIVLNFDSLQDSLSNPSYEIVNFDFDRPNTLHFFTKLIWLTPYAQRSTAWDEDDFVEFLIRCKAFDKNVDEDTMRKLFYTFTGKLAPVDSVMGSLAAQEVMKACSGKYMPVKQFMYIDHLKAFPDVKLPFTGHQYKYTISYGIFSGAIAVFGNDVVNRVKDSKVFIMGAGAIGCELLKNLALMGVGASSDGKIALTDMDHIEKSNLNRQFLFRDEDIGKSKSVTAMEKTLELNKDVNIECYEERVCPESDDIFNSEFFNELTCVLTAVDNVKARKYIDTKCVGAGIPLIDSGTLGTKSHVQTIIPNLSVSYNSHDDYADEGGIPLCTLKNFPFLFEHVVQYARDTLEELFVVVPNAYINANDHDICNKGRDELIGLHRNMSKICENYAKTFEDCVKFGYSKWHEYFRDSIYSIVQQYPEDFESDAGKLFWSGTKRFPAHWEFDTGNKTHMDFVKYTAQLWAWVCGIDDERFYDYEKNIKTFNVPKLVKSKVDISDKQDNPEPSGGYDKLSKQDVLDSINKLLNSLESINPIEFEKDDDSNHHIDFITAASNMRAMNYHIKIEDRLTVKQIAGKIIPAINTTTSLISGLVALEYYKICQGRTKLEDYSDASCNLAINHYLQSEPGEVDKLNINKEDYSLWTIKHVDGKKKLRDLVYEYDDAILRHKKLGNVRLELTCISHAQFSVYNKFFGDDDDDMEKTLKEIILENAENTSNEEDIGIVLKVPDDDDSSSDDSNDDSSDSDSDSSDEHDMKSKKSKIKEPREYDTNISDEKKEQISDYLKKLGCILVKVDMS
jgi:ubiquitin-activating enzyme E1